MSKTMLIIEFSHKEPWGDALVAQLTPMAKDIATESELIWKTWYIDQENEILGAVYLFSSSDAVDIFMEKHEKRLKGVGITEFSKKIFPVVEELTRITCGIV